MDFYRSPVCGGVNVDRLFPGYSDSRQGREGAQQRSVEEAPETLPGAGEEIQRLPGFTNFQRVLTSNKSVTFTRKGNFWEQRCFCYE